MSIPSVFPSTETEASRDGTDVTCAALNCKSPPPDGGGAVSPGKGTSFHAVLNCKSPPWMRECRFRAVVCTFLSCFLLLTNMVLSGRIETLHHREHKGHNDSEVQSSRELVLGHGCDTARPRGRGHGGPATPTPYPLAMAARAPLTLPACCPHARAEAGLESGRDSAISLLGFANPPRRADRCCLGAWDRPAVC